MSALLVRTRGPWRAWRTSGPSPGPTIPVEIRDAASDRARRLLGAEIRYIAHPSFDDPDARDAILAPMPTSDLAPAPRRAEAAASLPPYLAGLYHEALLLSREQEAHLFRKMNYLKYRARRLRDRIDPARAAPPTSTRSSGSWTRRWPSGPRSSAPTCAWSSRSPSGSSAPATTCSSGSATATT